MHPQPTSVLIVDDDRVTTVTLSALLAAAGYAVRTAANGREAWDLLTQAPAQVVISDWHMPEMDGLELCRRVRGHASEPDRGSPYTYFILITAYGGKQQYMLGMEAGADDFITKPLDFDELRARLRAAERILGLRQQLRQLEGLLPICSYCKRIKDDGGHWESLERYVAHRSDAQFSHGICEQCYQTVVSPDLDRLATP